MSDPEKTTMPTPANHHGPLAGRVALVTGASRGIGKGVDGRIPNIARAPHRGSDHRHRTAAS